MEETKKVPKILTIVFGLTWIGSFAGASYIQITNKSIANMIKARNTMRGSYDELFSESKDKGYQEKNLEKHKFEECSGDSIVTVCTREHSWSDLEGGKYFVFAEKYPESQLKKDYDAFLEAKKAIAGKDKHLLNGSYALWAFGILSFIIFAVSFGVWMYRRSVNKEISKTLID